MIPRLSNITPSFFNNFNFFGAVPPFKFHTPWNPPINKLFAMTRWHGTCGANGFRRNALPTTLSRIQEGLTCSWGTTQSFGYATVCTYFTFRNLRGKVVDSLLEGSYWRCLRWPHFLFLDRLGVFCRTYRLNRSRHIDESVGIWCSVYNTVNTPYSIWAQVFRLGEFCHHTN